MITGFLHPGAMGATIASACRGTRVWASEGRSAASAERASVAAIDDVGTVAALVAEADTIISVRPPAAAHDVAREVADLGFDGLYVDANAVSPTTAREIGRPFTRFVDGGIIGPPVAQAGTTRLYLAGDGASDVAERWADSALEVRIIDAEPGAASAVKSGFAAWTKGTSALLLAVRAYAEAEGVSADLIGEWQTSMPDLVARSEHTAAGVGPKAWRFGGEMEEIADAFAAVGLPAGFHQAAALVYDSLHAFKDATPPPLLDEVIDTLLG